VILHTGPFGAFLFTCTCCKPWRNAETWVARAGAVVLSRKPITGIADRCCSLAASGQAAAAPPRRVMNSRRLIGHP